MTAGKLTHAQDTALFTLATHHQASDDGWIEGGFPAAVKQRLIHALQRRHMIESDFPELRSASDRIRWRITPAGRAYMANPK